ncbi:MAG: TRAP transporter small permease subunit [Alphaproteobacteria bacterium]
MLEIRRAGGIASVCRSALAALLLGMVVLNVANVITRHGFTSSIPGADEILVFAMIWLVFTGAALVAVLDRHLKFPVFADRLPARYRQPLLLFVSLGSAGLFAFTAVSSWQVLVKLDRIGQTSMAAGIPMTVPHSAVLLSFGLMAAIALWRCIGYLTGRLGSGRDGE